MPKETTQTISDWAEKTFGVAGSNARVAARANEEMAELLRKVTSVTDRSAEDLIAQECADVVIVLHRLARRCGYDLYEAVDAKMEINRQREWKQDGSGHGYHVRERKENNG